MTIPTTFLKAKDQYSQVQFIMANFGQTFAKLPYYRFSLLYFSALVLQSIHKKYCVFCRLNVHQVVVEHQGSRESQAYLAQQEEMEEKEMLVLGVRKENLENQERMN